MQNSTHMGFNGLMSAHVLRKMAFEHLVADLTMESFNIFVVARNVLL